MTPAEKKAFYKSAVHLGGLALLLGAALYCNGPAEKELHFQVVCREFVVPVPLRLSLHQEPTSVESVVANGFDASVQGAEHLQFSPDSQAPRPLALHAFALSGSADANQMPPQLALTPQGAAGKDQLAVRPGVVLKSAGGSPAKPVLTVESQRKDDVQATLSSDSLTLRGNRYSSPQIAGGSLLAAFRANASSAFVVGVDLTSEAPVTVDPASHLVARPSLTVTFRPEAGPLPFVTGQGENLKDVALRPSEGSGDLLFRGSLNPDLRLEEKTVPGILADRGVNLRLNVKSGRIERISLQPATEKANAPALSVKGVVITDSVRQDGHELLPTRVAEVLAEPYEWHGPMLIAAAFLLFGALKTVDRAIDVILEIYLPKG